MSESSNIQVKPGHIVVEKGFDVGGTRKDGSKFEAKGFKVRIVFEDQADMVAAAARSVIIAVQGPIREALRDGKPLPFGPGVMVTVNSKGQRTITPEERDRMENEALLARIKARGLGADKEAELLKLLGLVGPEEAPAPAPPKPTYDRVTLAKASLDKLREWGEAEGFEGVDEMTRKELVEELGSIGAE